MTALPALRLRRRSWLAAALPAVVLATLPLPAGAIAGGSSVLPLAVTIPGASSDAAVLERFAAECRRRGYLAVASITVAGPPAPRASAALDTAVRLIGQLHLPEALEQLDLAAADAVLTGGAGLTAAQLADIYFYRAIARQKLSPADPPRFWDDYVRAATVHSERVLDPGRFAPAAVDAWRRAATAVQRGARGTLVVRAAADASITVDAHTPVRSPALVPALAYGEHLVRVEEPGRWPWAITVRLATPSVEMDVPIRAPLTLDDVTAAVTAQRRGASYALVAQPRTAAGERLLDLRLVEASTRLARAASVVVATSDGGLEAAMARVASSVPAAPGAPAAAVFGEVPAAGPSRRLTTLLVVLGVAGGIAAGLLVGSLIRSSPQGSGFPVVVDLGRARP